MKQRGAGARIGSMASGNGTARLDRIERALELLIADREPFRVEHKHLFTSI
jgi:hypothetical protein